MEQITVITLQQPWATMVAKGIKLWETRSFKVSYRGILYIHSSIKFPDECKAMCLKTPFYNYIKNIDELPLGKIIARVNLVSIIATDDWIRKHSQNNADHDREYHLGNYGPKRYAWELKEHAQLTIPTPARGALSLWKFPKEKLLSI